VSELFEPASMPTVPLPQAEPVEADAGGPIAPLDLAALESEVLDLVGILSAVQETAYIWHGDSDRIEWESNVTAVLGVAAADPVATGQGFESFIVTEHKRKRLDAMRDSCLSATGDDAQATTYRVNYRFMPGGPRTQHSLWLEDYGRCWFDAEGRLLRARGVVRVVNEHFAEEQRALYRNDHDELTGQLNRIRLIEALGNVMDRRDPNQPTNAFLMVSVNNLAVLNETFGFDVGDEVIAATARVIRSKLRGGDTLGRYSSNKFGIILNGCGAGAMRIAADRFIKAVRENIVRTSACQVSASISIGGVVLPDHATTVSQALSRSLKALDTARQRRHDVFQCYEPSPVHESTRRRNMMLVDQLVSALEQDRMTLALQPIVSTASREVAFYEALLRMQMPDERIVSAGQFIEVAEQLGYARMIDRRALELAADVLKRYPGITLSLNVSSQTSSDHEWLLALHRLSGGRREMLGRLIVEITETAAIHDIDQLVTFVDALKELGCRVAIDDFGAGYTSFKNLKMLAVDMVKIDGTFVKDLAKSPSDHMFVRTFTELAANLGLETVAEWVGNEESARLLADLGITYMQGNFIGLPILTADFYGGPELRRVG
jgi:diguanylate cyclase (GGDEF)-like protein